MTTTHIRWMIRRDLPAVLAIEQESFSAPWDEPQFIHFLRQRDCIGMVAEQADRVVGFMLYQFHPKRLHLLNFAVAAGCRRQGVGAAMVAKLASKLSSDKRNSITLEVCEANLDGQLFFKSQGFRAVCVFRDFYDNGTDAYRMRLRCSDTFVGIKQSESAEATQ
jgi:ribosomal-protein-alanine N-acetyltransferase